jgi:hypothetical protein
MNASIGSNIRRVRERIAGAASACGRPPGEIELLAVSKTFPVEAISRAAEEGLLRFGENRVQEAEGKILFFRENAGFEWHLIGHLQTNKARLAAGLFDVIHSLDSVRLAEKLNQASLDLGKRLSVLLQVDLGGEETKHGADPGHLPEIVEEVSRFEGLQLDGLMTLPPYFEDPENARPYFAQLRELRDKLEGGQPGCLGRNHLSMGMSHDFEVAIQEGATIVRVGTSIFGSRRYE